MLFQKWANCINKAPPWETGTQLKCNLRLCLSNINEKPHGTQHLLKPTTDTSRWLERDFESCVSQKTVKPKLRMTRNRWLAQSTRPIESLMLAPPPWVKSILHKWREYRKLYYTVPLPLCYFQGHDEWKLKSLFVIV